MFKAFSRDNPIIPLVDLSRIDKLDVQEGYQHIFAGVTQAVRILLGHTSIILENIQAIHLIFLSSFLMHKLKNAK